MDTSAQMDVYAGRELTMVSLQANPVSGNDARDCDIVVQTRLTRTNPFEQLIQITRHNDQLFGRLNLLRTRLARARVYADDPCANRSLATVLVDDARRRFADVLVQVRSNRLEALGILRACGQIGSL